MIKEVLIERTERWTENGIAITELWINEETQEYHEMYRDPVSGYWTEL